jgi:hypothetical protein
VRDTLRLHAAARIAARLALLKRQAAQFGFADLQQRLLQALDGPRGEALRQRIVGQTPVALIDEFQDTSALQYALFDRLYRVADNAPDTALLLIGDPKQSIYRFRGADIGSYLRRARPPRAGTTCWAPTSAPPRPWWPRSTMGLPRPRPGRERAPSATAARPATRCPSSPWAPGPGRTPGA